MADPNGIETAFVAGLTDGHLEALARVAAKATESTGPWSESGAVRWLTGVRDWAREQAPPPWSGAPAPLRVVPTTRAEGAGR